MGCSGSTQTKAQSPAGSNAPQQKPADEPAVVPQKQTEEGVDANTLPPADDNKQEIIENQDPDMHINSVVKELSPVQTAQEDFLPVSSPKEQEAEGDEKRDEEKPTVEAQPEPDNTRTEEVTAAEQETPAVEAQPEQEAQNEQTEATTTTEGGDAPPANTCQENGEMIHETAVEPATPQDSANAQEAEQSAQQETAVEPQETMIEPTTEPQTEEGGDAERPTATEKEEGHQAENMDAAKPAEEE